MIFIGQASTLSNASVKAIRHYESLGLLPDLGRAGSYRVFTERDINIIKLIKQAQEVGFKLAELKSVLLSKEASIAWGEIENMMRLKEVQIAKEISILNEKQVRLRQYATVIRDCLSKDPNCS
ncbi:MerR family transcriptional regulator [Colwellia psychrerythraea]|uniref:Transcriptional regulator, MerR family n=1 Tax=Colwellia psychrerythraea TaxID=28229 RepID=A0A099KZ91_COLPS|nr:MerR family transcriptional regulator [Colwellia psychrerythraea]KGJ95931.1 transcriptional regulator, MerR family [Colwellia psychrerythraea]